MLRLLRLVPRIMGRYRERPSERRSLGRQTIVRYRFLQLRALRGVQFAPDEEQDERADNRHDESCWVK
jgi:hypothetical protein